ncbi:indolepyruvate ferredoxin oxidoreductase subunit alpha [Lawsonibacter sp. OA9]|uniref:Indolepyruvate oxidoreductase subunit IorA n=1 Tax=Flintibacter hominis TaxID=2763048 RepID=A0A8J6J7E1_9FIRM|nr:MULTISPECIES: indolepyruvate ferredoxin oxidoreductase subunit alpha [Eubacteriales]SCH33993.1 indolepyruvate ferredoxin oxidoreductase [uncultured Clostridium sp.]SCJ52722.1 indolepyruvate ferredoxin oxidoreductase [uncultured Flavonifractor sp.]MBC5721303.1 indolepyruvate ferredoxin oxidoreductase subunit alpha [Flintibacter hominis]MCH1980441.1 indolepyruvate ferredoxin oxidoreductase subunit alpha [Lawsonibacter sp. OA9]MCU6703570.1 indolepyruvate ferredoxin oxidoreductase subunit alpha
MKQLMLGNAAVARGLYEAGCCVISSYPGTPSTEITEEAAKFDDIYCEWAPNEKVAMEVAFGASLAGKRAFCGMKHVGLNVAADPLFTMSYTGVNGGMVIGVADDAGMHSSQNEQDSRRHAIAAKVPMLEPSDSAEALAFTRLAFALSEEFDTPVLLKMCTRVAHSQSLVELSDREERQTVPYEKNIAKYVMMPGNAIRRHPAVEERTGRLREWAETAPINRVEMGGTGLGIITSSTSYQYVKEVFGDSVSVLKLGMANPLPVRLIRDFAAKVDKLVVVEELDPIIEEHCRTLGLEVSGKDVLPMEGEFSQNLVAARLGGTVHSGKALDDAIPPRPPVMCAGCPHRGLFYTLNKNKCTVLGDIGCYTLGAVAPLSAMDMTLCMGASISAIHGFNKALGTESEGRTVAVIGDSTFMHSGMTGLANIAYNQSNSTVIILDNSITGMTGHQQNPTTGYNIKGDPAGKIDLEALCRAMGFNRVRVVDPYDLKATDQAVKEELAADEPSVIISRRPCALLKYVKHKAPLKVNTDKCIGCKSCMKIGCPAISMKEGKAHVDNTLCVGCGVCEQLCPVGAFESTGKEG